jgi:putative serine/threonine protein kinase
MPLRDITYLAKGKRGIASTAKLGTKTVLVKERNPAASVDTIAHEARILRVVNAHGIGPQLIRREPARLVREYVKGEQIAPWTRNATPRAIRAMLARLLDQCRTLDTIHIDKQEMTRPYKHVLITRNVPTQIDFDRARESPRPRNVTQLCQFLTAGRYAHLLAQRGIQIDKERLLAAAKTYKNSYANKDYDRIRAIIKG